jgi:hypothetical protein
LSLLEGDDRAANRNYIREFVLARDRETGKRFGLAYAEAYYHIGPAPDPVDEYIKRESRPL